MPFAGAGNTHEAWADSALSHYALTGGQWSSISQYTCDDLALAIYEQTGMLRDAFTAYQLELEDLLTIDVPTIGDIARFGAVASEVVLWRTSLNILANLYTINKCWDA